MTTRRSALLGLLALLAACDKPIPQSTDGKVLFEYTCARCHANDGRGDPALKKSLGVADLTDPALQRRLTDEDIINTIRNGSKSGRMPPLGNTYTAEQLDAIVKHVRSLSR